MRKRLSLVLIILMLPLSFLTSGDHFDIALQFGDGILFGDRIESWWPKGVNLNYGVNFGLTARVEADLWVTSSITPIPFKSNTIGLEFDFTLLGRRSTKSRVAGEGINMLVGFGAFFSSDDFFTSSYGAGPFISFAPLTVGSPIGGRRERLLTMRFGYDFVAWRFFISLDLLNLDFYLRGSWRDYEF